MSAPTLITPAYVTPAKGEPVRARASRNRWWLIALGLLIAFMVFVTATARPSDYRDLSIGNSTDSGTRAVAQILRAQGVTVRQVDQLSATRITDPANTTLVIADPAYLTEPQLRSIKDYAGPIVFLGLSGDALGMFDDGLSDTYTFLPETVAADCTNAHAVAAEAIRVEWAGIIASGATEYELCFTQRSNVAGAAFGLNSGQPVTFIADSWLATNGSLELNGNAALVLRSTGSVANVVWYLGSPFDPTLLTGGGGAPPDSLEANPDFLPPGFGSAIYALALAALVAAFWRARRFGPLAVEPLPVVVRASEATRGRARLYRRAQSRGRATAALRAATAGRIGRRLGVPRASTPDALVQAVAQATERPAAEVRAILYGQAPHDDQHMLDIIEQLDTLERQVHRT